MSSGLAVVSLRASAALLLAAVAGGSLIVGCDIPTAAPIVEQRWALVAAETTLGVEDLLPNGQISLIDTTEAGAGARLLAVGSAAVESPDVSCELPGSAGEVVSGEGSITVSAEPICVAWTLAELCPECRVGQPIPRIDTNKQQTWELPPEVVSVQISSGRVVLSLDHDLDFAPLRAGELGVVAISIGTGDAPEQELLRWVLDQDLEPGTPVSHTLDFSQNPVTVSGGLRLQFFISTAPDGSEQPVTDLTQVIRARAQVQSLTIDSAVVRVDDLDLGGEPREFDLGEQSEVEELVKRIQEGTATVTIVNDFPVGVSGTITLGETTRAIDLEPEGTTEVSISYTRKELQKLLSGTITYAWTGSITNVGEHTFDASMQLTITVRIDITLRTEPEE